MLEMGKYSEQIKGIFIAQIAKAKRQYPQDGLLNFLSNKAKANDLSPDETMAITAYFFNQPESTVPAQKSFCELLETSLAAFVSTIDDSSALDKQKLQEMLAKTLSSDLVTRVNALMHVAVRMENVPTPPASPSLHGETACLAWPAAKAVPLKLATPAPASPVNSGLMHQ